MSVEDEASPAAHVELREISKNFGGTQALDDVSLTIARGSVHALVGENGAGKSTLGKIVSGVLAPDRGTVLVGGKAVSFRSPREALSHGIAAVSQELTIVPARTVEENVFLGVEPSIVGFVRRRALRQRFLDVAGSAGFDLPPDRPAGALRTGEQQEVEILGALVRNARLIVMDEPSAALTVEETTKLHEIIRSLARRGTTVLLVSHFLREVLQLADTVTVLRDGRLVRTSAAEQETEDSLVEAMIGRSLDAQFPPKTRPPSDAPVVLGVRGLHAQGVSDVSLDVRAGEIVGLAGLVGAGRTELARAIFGAQRIDSGNVELAGGRQIKGGGSRAALRSGVVMIPESRTEDGLVLGRSVTENVSLPSLRRLSRLGMVRRRLERRETGRVLDRVDVRGSRTGPVLALSGGNQQKSLFARSLLSRPTVLIADEPTRGVDVGAKRAIYELIVELADEGLGVLLISSEIEEILGLTHRVLVMRGGRVVAEFDEETMSESSILSAAFATAPSARSA